MNGLKALEFLKKCITDAHFDNGDFVDIALEAEECSKIIEKELKAFEIIKKKEVNVNMLKASYSPIFSDEYYNGNVSEKRNLNKEEYDLLKEELK